MIDTHSHLNLLPLSDKPELYIQRAKEIGVERIAVVGTNLETSQEAVKLATTYPEVFAIVGIHPEEIQNSPAFAEIEAMAGEEVVKGIGECGLDYYRLEGGEDIVAKIREEQLELFRLHLDLAFRLHKPLTIHCRSDKDSPFDAYKDMQEELERAKKQGKLPVFILHCVSGPVEYVRRAVELGGYISFAGNVTYPSAHAIRELLSVTPLDRLLVETDAPFLAPQGKRGQTNEPAFVSDTLHFIADTISQPLKELDQITAQTTRRIFSL